MPIKLVARKNFANSPRLNLSVSKDGGKDGKPVLKHENHIHKGLRFDFPSQATVYDDLPAGSPERETIQRIVNAQAVTIVEDTPKSKAIISKIDREVAEETAANEAFEKRRIENEPAKLKDILAALPDIIGQIGAASSKGK